MKTKLITTLTALLMLVGIGAQAQTDNQTRANAESTDLEGDLNHDGEVNAADVVCLVDIIMKKESHSQPTGSYWYYGTVEDLEKGSAPSASTAITYTNEMYNTYDAVQSTWYKLDTSVESLRIPYAVGGWTTNSFTCIAVPVSSGINDVLNVTQSESLIGGSLTQSNKTINGVEYIVWTGRTPGRFTGYLVNSNPHSNSYWYYGKFEDLENGSAPSANTAITYTNDMYETFDAVQSTWYKLDTTVEKLEIPYAVGNLSESILCIAVPVSSGINDILDTTNASMINVQVEQSNKTINGVEYIVWTGLSWGRLMGYLVNSNPHSNSYWYYGTVTDLNNGSEPNESKAITYTNDDYQTI